MVAARLANLGHGQKASTAARPADPPVTQAAAAKSHGQKASTAARPADPPVTQAAAAKSQNVGERTTRAARKILNKAPVLVPSVDAGKLSVDAGERLADEPVAVQEAVAEQLDRGVDAKTAIKNAVKRPKATPTPKANPVED